MVETLSKPNSESKEPTFTTKYSQPFFSRYVTCLWKQNLSYWRNPQYTAVRFFYAVIISLMFGTICWKFCSRRETQHDIFNAMGAMGAAVLFIGITNATSVQPVISIERFVSYRERERESCWDVFIITFCIFSGYCGVRLHSCAITYLWYNFLQFVLV